jgi:hypothetical protein
MIATSPKGLARLDLGAASTSYVATGQALGGGGAANTGVGGVCHVFAAAGTYSVNVQFRSTSGTITAKERKLWVYTLGY